MEELRPLIRTRLWRYSSIYILHKYAYLAFASVGWVSSLIQRAAASQKRINEFLEINEKVIDNGNRTIMKFKTRV